MQIFNIHEAKKHLSKLLDAAIIGEDFVIAKSGKPYVRLTPILQKERIPGAAKGKGCLTEAFFEPLSKDELKEWQ